MKTLGQILKEKRQSSELKLKDIANYLQIDQALVSKFESGDRKPTREQIIALSKYFEIKNDELLQIWLSEKLMSILEGEENIMHVLKLTENTIKHNEHKIPDNPLALSRRIQNLLLEIDNLHNRWKMDKPTDKAWIAQWKNALKINYTFESNRIEGNTLSLDETQKVIYEGLTIGGKSMNEHFEAINHAEAFDYILALINNNEALNENVFKEIHRLVLKNIDNKNAGKYRATAIKIKNSQYTPPQAYLVNELMTNFFISYNKEKTKSHPVILAANLHERITSIHPFSSGNGHVARLVMNFILLKHGYTLANIKGSHNERMEYFYALEKVRDSEDVEIFQTFIIKTAKQSLEEHLKLVAST